MAAYLSGNKHFLYKRVIPKYTSLTLTYASFPFSQLRNHQHHIIIIGKEKENALMMHMKIDANALLACLPRACIPLPFDQVGMFLTQVLMDIVN